MFSRLRHRQFFNWRNFTEFIRRQLVCGWLCNFCGVWMMLRFVRSSTHQSSPYKFCKFLDCVQLKNWRWTLYKKTVSWQSASGSCAHMWNAKKKWQKASRNNTYYPVSSAGMADRLHIGTTQQCRRLKQNRPVPTCVSTSLWFHCEEVSEIRCLKSLSCGTEQSDVFALPACTGPHALPPVLVIDKSIELGLLFHLIVPSVLSLHQS